MARQSAHNDGPRARAKTWAPQIDAARRPPDCCCRMALPMPAGSLRGLLSEWAVAEVAPGRLMPWLPVAFGFGIVALLYRRSRTGLVGGVGLALAWRRH